MLGREVSGGGGGGVYPANCPGVLKLFIKFALVGQDGVTSTISSSMSVVRCAVVVGAVLLAAVVGVAVYIMRVVVVDRQQYISEVVLWYHLQLARPIVSTNCLVYFEKFCVSFLVLYGTMEEVQ